MTLCVCGHPSADHAQFDHGEYCFSCNCRDWRPIHKEAVDSEESTAPLSAGVTPEGLAGATVSENVKPSALGDHWRGFGKPEAITGYVNPDGSGEGNWVTPSTDEDRADWARNGCNDPDHPDGAYCRNTTGLATCYPPDEARDVSDPYEMLSNALARADEARAGEPRPMYGWDCPNCGERIWTAVLPPEWKRKAAAPVDVCSCPLLCCDSHDR